MIASMGLKREDVYILNIVKCRPPGNRKPKWDEIDACGKHLTKQLLAIYPDVIIALGNTALEGLTGTGGITQRCGKCELLCIECSDSPKICKLIPCYHPSALLRNPKWKDAAWHALQTAASLIKEVV
jgi:uracil-DNA glycosylase family 4